jgi:hypothetical protein
MKPLVLHLKTALYAKKFYFLFDFSQFGSWSDDDGGDAWSGVGANTDL